ncbi:Palmitoyl-protein_thioesterase [Hexamita inflata]|uniref:Palmitoyl-protein thioesterase n=1 Tax=Hexamita inflata TaxID=28002 RepID=A0AA86QNH3_9EUKA|nr:Palmitoyl-protein thioesterase [Hexamita inflata]CAI9975957.1 Palmitoyl-protein thioesterase [Hexamita inflata]
MHGFTENKDAMNFLDQYLKEVIPNLYVLNCEVGNGKHDSLFMDTYSSVKELTKCIVNDPNLKDGFISLGLSQGGYLLRGYLQTRTETMPKVLRFITLASPLGGFYCGVTQACGEYPTLPHFLNELIDDLEYTEFIQNLLTAAGYWRNPYKLDEYLDYGTHLAHMNNEVNFNQTLKDNFMQPDKFILFGSDNDGLITPWQSTWFGYYNDGDDKVVIPMEERDIYKKDLFGLKTLNEQGRIHRINSGMNHHKQKLDEKFIKEQLAPWVQMDM